MSHISLTLQCLTNVAPLDLFMIDYNVKGKKNIWKKTCTQRRKYVLNTGSWP